MRSCRWDEVCCEKEDWKAKAGVDVLEHGAQQPFYQVLVDERDWAPQGQEAFVAYAAQEEVLAPQVRHLSRGWMYLFEWCTVPQSFPVAG